MQWIAAWHVKETTMKLIVRKTARGDKVVCIQRPKYQHRYYAPIRVKSLSAPLFWPEPRSQISTTGTCFNIDTNAASEA
jgi:hypothetical protein